MSGRTLAAVVTASLRRAADRAVGPSAERDGSRQSFVSQRTVGLVVEEVRAVGRVGDHARLDRRRAPSRPRKSTSCQATWPSLPSFWIVQTQSKSAPQPSTVVQAGEAAVGVRRPDAVGVRRIDREVRVGLGAVDGVGSSLGQRLEPVAREVELAEGVARLEVELLVVARRSAREEEDVGDALVVELAPGARLVHLGEARAAVLRAQDRVAGAAEVDGVVRSPGDREHVPGIDEGVDRRPRNSGC